MQEGAARSQLPVRNMANVYSSMAAATQYRKFLNAELMTIVYDLETTGHHLGGEAVCVERGFRIFGVDAAHIGAAGDGAEVVACDAAGGSFAGDDGAGRAVVDGAFGLVAAHDAAHLAVAGDDAGELAVDEGAVVDAYDTAGGGVGRRACVAGLQLTYTMRLGSANRMTSTTSWCIPARGGPMLTV